MGKGPLEGLTVIDASSIVAGPMAATVMGDYGAEVIKIEHPARGDALRNMGFKKDGVPLWWKMVSRNKKAVTLNLSSPEGRDIFLKMVAKSDVLIENFRPGTLERWGLGFDVLHSVNRGLVMLRVTGFGQTGPYAHRPGFGTVAEAMSGFAHITGAKDGPPTLPSMALADGIAGLYGAAAVMFALRWRDVGGGKGEGQVIDLSLYEPLFYILGAQVSYFDQLGFVQERSGNRGVMGGAPRNAYQTKDGRWVAFSSNAPAIVERIIRLLDLEKDPRFATLPEAYKNGNELDALLGKWIQGHDFQEVLSTFEEYEAAIGPVYSVADQFQDPHFLSRQDIVEILDSELGKIKMQGLVPRFSATPGSVEFAGPPKGAHNQEILRDWLGLGEEKLKELKDKGVI
jgi:crotonobetainyl-CoA:carnitine CoA-transferase CaiB-like acyl-CoA transferase